MKISAAYIRVSTDDQLEYSPDSQIKLIKDFAKRNELILPDEYIFQDDGISGKDAKHRPEFNRMLALAKSEEHPIDTIIVWKFSRFARNQEESIVIKNLLKKINVSVVSVSEPVIDGAFGTLIERIIEWMDEYYLINLSTEVKRGMIERASRGEIMSIAPVGYSRQGETFVMNDDAKYVKMIFGMFLNGNSRKNIARTINADGFRTRYGNPIDSRNINYILNNPAYIGKIRWSTEGKAASRHDYDADGIIVVDGNFEAIIDESTWNAVQDKLKTEKELYKPHQKREEECWYMTKGLVRCSSCGEPIGTLRKGKALQCLGYQRGKCKDSHYINYKKLDEAVIEGLKKMDVEFRIEPREEITIDNSKLIEAEKRKLARIRDAYEDGVYTLEEFKKSKAKVEEEISRLQIKPKKPKKKVEITSVVQFLESDATPRDKNIMLRSIINYIIYDKKNDSLEITLKDIS